MSPVSASRLSSALVPGSRMEDVRPGSVARISTGLLGRVAVLGMVGAVIVGEEEVLGACGLARSCSTMGARIKIAGKGEGEDSALGDRDERKGRFRSAENDST